MNTALNPVASNTSGQTHTLDADHTNRLAQLKSLLEQNLITQDDYDAAKAEVIKKITG